VTINSGVGGATNTTGAQAGGAAGTLTIAAAAGGAASAGTGNGGLGGSLILNAGAGGTSFGGTAGVAGNVKIANNVATPSGGSVAAFIQIGSTAGFGIYFGAGAPSSLTAAQGSLYLNSTGSSTTTRAYFNTTGSTTWTNVITTA
jgi:hypothetical protein